MTEEQFLGMKLDALSEELYSILIQAYRHHTQSIAQQSAPVFREIHQTRGEQVENVAVPFTDGKKGLQVVVNLKKAVESEGRELVKAYERSVTLAVIDEEWKEHLREMDDLKRSVQQAVYEQKDPLLIYKLESFKLFETLVDRLNRDTLSLVFRGQIMSGEGQQRVSEASTARQQTDMSKLQTSRDEVAEARGAGAGPDAPAPRAPQAPIKAELKVGRNDPCPCGSGKKYKNCHGKEA